MTSFSDQYVFCCCLRLVLSQGKGNSIPGVKRGDNPWRQLTEKGQSISIGDRLCMQYKKNGPGGRVRRTRACTSPLLAWQRALVDSELV